MTKKSKLILAAVIILIVLIAAFILFVPQHFFDEDHEITVHRVALIDSNGLTTDITDAVKTERLGFLLHLMEGRRYRTSFAPYQLTDTQYEISGQYRDKPFHIILGNSGVNYLYESSDKGGYKIKNADAWLSIMYTAVQND